MNKSRKGWPSLSPCSITILLINYHFTFLEDMFCSFLSNRCLSLLEYQAKELLQEAHLPIQRFIVLNNSDKSNGYDSDMLREAKYVVIKAQVPAGGRGKGYFVNDANETILQ